MNLRSYCKTCNNPNHIDGSGIQFRRDLERKYGKTVTFNCYKCNTPNEKQINHIFAVESKLPLVLSSIFGIGTILWGILIRSKSQESVIWTTAIGAMFLTAGFYSNYNTSARAFNKTFV